ncbi:hypothetical protein IMZ48_39890 [Candidatus Bathyarchaeota archaeon]|nr:hypothetical protein [Candidatus Bathyarchaeota archaeon]
MVDQELALFHDTAPILAISDLQCPLPGPEALWMATSVGEWSSNAQKIYGCTNTVNPQMLDTPPISPSLCDLFQDFLHDNLGRRQAALTPMHMRLLLHPLQSLLCHLRQMLSCFSDGLSPQCSPSRSVTKSSTQLRLEEVQVLLQKWYELSMALHKASLGCYITRCNLVLYHLISLNAVADFPEIERLARREAFDGSYWDLAARHKRCVSSREESVFHSGQVMRLVRTMAPARRPSWWSAAIYRATLILWVDSVSRLDPSFQNGIQSSPAPVSRPSPGQREDAGSPGVTPASTEPVAIDRVTPEDASIIAYLWSGDGVAVLTGADGSTVGLDKPSTVLSYGVMAIDEGMSTRIGDGLKRKLVTLGNHWNVDGLGPVS